MTLEHLKRLYYAHSQTINPPQASIRACATFCSISLHVWDFTIVDPEVPSNQRAVLCLFQKNRKNHKTFPGVQRAGESSRVRNRRRQRFKSLRPSASQNTGLGVRGADPRMSMKKNKKPTNKNKKNFNQTSFQSNGSAGGRVGCGERADNESDSCFVWDYIQNSFSEGEASVAHKRKKTTSLLRTPHRCKTVIRDGTRAWPHTSTTQWHEKSNGTRLPPNFNTRLILFLLLLLLLKPIVVRM